MSVRWRRWVMDECQPGNNSKWILFVMADAVDEKGIFYRGIEWLSERSDMSIRTVQRKITHLIDKGYLDQTEKTSRGRRATFKLTGKLPEKEPLPLLQVYKKRDVTPANMADVNQSPTPDNMADVTPDNLTPTPDNLAGVHNIGINHIKPYRNQTREIPPHPPSPNGRENLPKRAAVIADSDDDENINNVIHWINKTYPELVRTWTASFEFAPSDDFLRRGFKSRRKIGKGFPQAHITFMQNKTIERPEKYLVVRSNPEKKSLIERDLDTPEAIKKVDRLL